MQDELRRAILATSQKLGVDPVDLATAMSYETAGTFDPWKRGPTTKWGTHRGLIQWGEPQARQYGVSKDTPIPQQVEAAGKYLVDRGVRPGHGLLEIYSAINAGGVGDKFYGRSDAHAGGAPGSVRDKVTQQMAGHRDKATRLLGSTDPITVSPGAPAPALPPPINVTDRTVASPSTGQPSINPAPATAQGISPMISQMLGSMAAQQQEPQFSPVQMQGPSPQQATALTEFIKALKSRAAV